MAKRVDRFRLAKHHLRHDLLAENCAVFARTGHFLKTPSICRITDSTSPGNTLSPPTLITSDARPEDAEPFPIHFNAVPVLNQPSAVNGLGALR